MILREILLLFFGILGVIDVVLDDKVEVVVESSLLDLNIVEI